MRLASLVSTSIAIILSAAAGTANAAIITLRDPKEIAQAAAVKAAIDALADTAAVCSKTTSKTALQCECSSKVGMARLQSAYDSAISGHSDWARPNTTVWWSGTALNFSAITRVLGTCP